MAIKPALYERACQRIFTVRAISPPRTRQLILAGVEVRELGEQPNLGWDAACQQGIRSPFTASIRKHSCTAHESDRANRTTTRSKGGEYQKKPTRAKETFTPAPSRRPDTRSSTTVKFPAWPRVQVDTAPPTTGKCREGQCEAARREATWRVTYPIARTRPRVQAGPHGTYTWPMRPPGPLRPL